MKTRPETTKGEATRGRILHSAIKLAADRGFADMSFQMIADELGLSQSAVMYHFPDKNSLFRGMVETIVRHNHETVDALSDIADDSGRRLLKHCLGNVLWALRYRDSDAQVLILLYYLAGRGADFASLFSGMIAGGRERIKAHLLAGGRERLFSVSDPDAAAALIQDSLFGAMLHAASSPAGSVREEEIERKLRLLIASVTGWKE
ncbi:MAG: TetR/AcrR family transcriptional regulator [Elusimicrobiales bacterium]|jgi:AcrR family transcriptional regulator|nr:TetR/AcrR family transcriptional regulator [Elusimicrobiales bacterium]